MRYYDNKQNEFGGGKSVMTMVIHMVDSIVDAIHYTEVTMWYELFWTSARCFIVYLHRSLVSLLTLQTLGTT